MIIRLEKTKGTQKDYNKFIELYNKLGIRIKAISNLEVNLNFGETK